MASDTSTRALQPAFPAETPQQPRNFRLFRYFLRRMMARCRLGSLVVATPDGNRIELQAENSGPQATVQLRRWRAVRRLITGGDIGFAESYMEGDWTSPDLVPLMELAARNIDAMDADLAPSLPLRLFNSLLHRLHANSRAGSRRNIAAHYDLGNDFYACWLDPGMSYSSALYGSDTQSLEAAQAAKQDFILDRLDLKGGERVLEIGCGWGGLAERLIERGCHVTGVTLSQEQLDYTNDRLARANLAAQADIRLQDYRDIEGTFDRIVSIEMLEAVGQEYWPTYFETLRRRLAPGGTVVLQVITIDERRFENYARTVDFIQRYIFPGGMLPSPPRIEREIASAGLHLASVRTFGDSYARTLDEWARRFQESWPKIADQGFPIRFKRMWEYYLAYCEAGFRAGTIDVAIYQLTAAPPSP